MSERSQERPAGDGARTLRAESLVKAYRRRRVVNGLSLEVNRGEIVGLLGPNGAGKTTSFYMIMGALTPNDGDIFLDDRKITGLPMYKRAQLGIGYLPQEVSIFRKLSVYDNVYSIPEMRGYPAKESRKRTEEVLDLMKVDHLRGEKGYQLSGGERRRVEIARSLVLGPTFFLLDEPFTGIDPKTRAEIQDIILDLKRMGIGTLVTDHNVRETLEITDRAYIIYDGKILLQGDSESLVNDPKAREVYLGERFKL
jgi:lipopolysaccharide export system ATP-binding protein